MKEIILILTAVISLASTQFAQVRPVGRSDAPAAKSVPTAASFAAKYEGGMFGYNEKEQGTLKFDDENKRLVFYNKEGKEHLSIPYDALVAIYPQSRSVRSTTGTVISVVPLPGAGLAGLMREKRRYMVLQFRDADTDIRGVANFKLKSKDLLESAIRTLGEKARLQQRGDAYYRPKAAGDEI